jgi:hypothetical protein
MHRNETSRPQGHVENYAQHLSGGHPIFPLSSTPTARRHHASQPHHPAENLGKYVLSSCSVKVLEEFTR